MTAAFDSSTRGCLATDPTFGLDQEDADVQGLDEGLLDGSVQLNGQNLNRFLQAWFTCLIAMDGKLFRPRWQPEPPNLPDGNWAAFGITRRRGDTFAVEKHIEVEQGMDEIHRHEEIDVLVSFYGPGADANASALREGMQVSQNREPLMRQGMGLIEASEVLPVPSTVKQRWLYRSDITVRLRREIVRAYPVLHLLAADGTLKANAAITTITEPLLVEQA